MSHQDLICTPLPLLSTRVPEPELFFKVQYVGYHWIHFPMVIEQVDCRSDTDGRMGVQSLVERSLTVPVSLRTM